MDIMSVSLREKDELEPYQLKVVARVWYDKRNNDLVEGLGPVAWEELKRLFLIASFLWS